MTISEKISYIKGLAEGLALDTETKEGKVLAAIIDLLEDMVDEIDAIDEACAEIGEQLDAVDEDLALIEDEFYADEDDEDEYYDDEEVYEVECPNCNDIIYLDESMLEEEEMICPGCGTRLEFEFECDCDGTTDCDCGCQEDK